MEYTDVDMSSESKELLEKPHEYVILEWRSDQIKGLLWCLGALLLGFFGLVFELFDNQLPLQHGSIIENIILGPKNFLITITLIALVLLLLFSPFGIILFTKNLILGSFGIGIPHASKKPIDSVRYFYSNTICESKGLPEVKQRAFIYLLDQAKKQFKDIDDFVKYYEMIVKNLKVDLADFFQVNHHKHHNRQYAIKDIKELSSEGVMKTYEVNIVATQTTGDGSDVSPKKVVGKILIYEKCTVVDVGGRWYLTSGNWTGRLESGSSKV